MLNKMVEYCKVLCDFGSVEKTVDHAKLQGISNNLSIEMNCIKMIFCFPDIINRSRDNSSLVEAIL